MVKWQSLQILTDHGYIVCPRGSSRSLLTSHGVFRRQTNQQLFFQRYTDNFKADLHAVYNYGRYLVTVYI